jgi:hypothetical protein
LADNDGMASRPLHAQTPGAGLASLSKVIHTYEAIHGVSVAQIGKAATQLGFMGKLEADLRGALREGRPIPNLDSYVVTSLKSLAPQSRAVSTVAA